MKPICMPTQLEMGDMEEMHTPTVCATNANLAVAIFTLRTSGRSELSTMRMEAVSYTHLTLPTKSTV